MIQAQTGMVCFKLPAVSVSKDFFMTILDSILPNNSNNDRLVRAASEVNSMVAAGEISEQEKLNLLNDLAKPAVIAETADPQEQTALLEKTLAILSSVSV